MSNGVITYLPENFRRIRAMLGLSRRAVSVATGLKEQLIHDIEHAQHTRYMTVYGILQIYNGLLVANQMKTYTLDECIARPNIFEV